VKTVIDALSQTVDVPLWLLLGLAGYHRVLQVSGRAWRNRRANREAGKR